MKATCNAVVHSMPDLRANVVPKPPRAPGVKQVCQRGGFEDRSNRVRGRGVRPVGVDAGDSDLAQGGSARGMWPGRQRGRGLVRNPGSCNGPGGRRRMSQGCIAATHLAPRASRRVDAPFPHPAVQGRPADAEPFGSLGAVAAGAFQGLEDAFVGAARRFDLAIFG